MQQVHLMSSGVSSDLLLVLAWMSTLFSGAFALRLLHALWKGVNQGVPKSVLAGLSLFTFVVAWFCFPESARLYTESAGFKTGELYMTILAMMPGGMLLVAPFVLLFSGSPKPQRLNDEDQ